MQLFNKELNIMWIFNMELKILELLNFELNDEIIKTEQILVIIANIKCILNNIIHIV